MTKLEVLVPRGATRAALAAALPHAARDAEEISSRVRLSFTPGSGDPGVHMLVTACDRYSGVASRVRLDEVTTLPALAVVDLPVQTVRDVLAVFKPPSGKDERASWENESFRVTVGDEDTTWDEAGQLLDGRSLTVPRLAPLSDSETAYPDLPTVLTVVMGHRYGVHDDRPRVAVNPTVFARAVASAKAHGVQRLDVVLHVGPTGRGCVTFTGDADLLGMVTAVRVDEDSVTFVDDARTAWAEQLAPLRRPSDYDPAARSAAAAGLREAMKGSGVFTFVKDGLYEVNLDELTPDDGVDGEDPS